MNSESRDLSVSVVVYELDLAALDKTLLSLRDSIQAAQRNASIGAASIDVIDNGHNPVALEGLLNRTFPENGDFAIRLISGHGNVGYGKGHNISIQDAQSSFHLVLNPDVVVSSTAIGEAINHLRDNRSAVMLTPEVRGPLGEKQYLCRHYPSLFLLYLRSFAPIWLRRRFQEQLAAYELRRDLDTAVPVSVPLATGCFMLARTPELQQIGGFSPAFFLYFEDYDLSMRLRALGEIVYVPSVKITHFGGNASKKGWNHIGMFARSAVTFFVTHGWRIW